MVVGGAIGARVHTSMAIGAKRDDEGGMVRTAITDASNMVRLQVRAAIGTVKGRWSTAALTTSSRSRGDICFNVAATRIHSPVGACSSGRGNRNGGICPAPKLD